LIRIYTHSLAMQLSAWCRLSF